MSQMELNVMSSSDPLNVEHCDHATEVEDDSPCCNNSCVQWVSKTWDVHPNIIKVLIVTIICYALAISGMKVVGFEKAAGVFGLAVFLSVCLIYKALRDHYGSTIYKYTLKPLVTFVQMRWRYIRW